MRIRYIENGDMVCFKGRSWIWLIILTCLLLGNFIAGGNAMLSKPISSWGPNIYIQLPLLAIMGVFLVRALTRKSEFYFDSKKKKVCYQSQSLWSEERGVINTYDILKIEIQEIGAGSDGGPSERLVIVCENKTIPMTLTYTNIINFKDIKEEIDDWLLNNGNV